MSSSPTGSSTSSSRLPPSSPELRGVNIPNRPEPARLLCTSNYQTLSPQSLAVCRDMGAVAGSKGIAIFNTASPHVPTLLLNHAYTGGISSQPMVLSFSRSDSNFLASARGSGIFVWDVSGRSLSPLQGRFGGLSEDPLDAINSIDWTTSNGDNKCLLASSNNAAGLWDMRQKNVRPSLRFSGPSNTADSPYRQIVSSDMDECAILDGSGIVRVFGTRMNADKRPNSCLRMLQAFRYSGVGISYMTSSRYLAWGVDEPNADPVVKIFSLNDLPSAVHPETPDEYWYMDTSPDRHSKTSNATGSSSLHSTNTNSISRECSVPDLACARVVPKPVKDRFLTLALDPSEKGWEAVLWKVNGKLERLLSFTGCDEHDPRSMDPRMRSIRAAELTISNDSELLLFCLTDDGYVTTHLIPEALPAHIQAGHKRNKSVPVATRKLDARNLPSAPASSTRLFNMVSSWAVSDPAKAWSRAASDTMTNSTEKVVNRRETPLVDEENPTAEGSLMPFEMEVPVSYSIVNANRSSEDTTISNTTSAISSLEEAKIDEANSKATKALMDRIETARIPCPRICGVSFSPGVGGLVSFNNGDVKSMFQWWKRSNPTRLASVPGIIGEATQSKSNKQAPMKRQTDPTYVDHSGGPPIAISSCPRTLKDLRDMTAAAREAQWREKHLESEESSAGESSHFYDDDSDGSSMSGEDHGDEHNNQAETSRSKNAIADETVEHHDADMSQEQYPRGFANETYKHSPYHSALPLVKVSHEIDRVALNNQNPGLALALRLGKFKSSGDLNDENTRADAADTLRARQVGLPSYRSLLPSSQTIGARQESHKSTRSIDEERGVHGGEFSVRPNVHESMVFLRKILTHRSPDGDNYSPVLGSPLDDQMQAGTRFPGLSESYKRSFSTQELSRLGVYTAKAGKLPDLRKKLSIYEEILSHNARACASDGQKEKSDSWLLLLKIVRDRVTHNYHGHDGWGGSTGGSLGAGLIDSVLRYYESTGDVQMLATLVCVLRYGQRLFSGGKIQPFLLLSKANDARYDMYLRRYSDLLFGWGLLTSRAEVVKHLEHPYNYFDGARAEVQDADKDQARTPGIAFSFHCTRCSSNSEFGTNYCRKCQDYAFRCTICDSAVRGLLTVCSSCGHGGHVNHIKEWFLSHTECPSGCGCSCKVLLSEIPGEEGALDEDRGEVDT